MTDNIIIILLIVVFYFIGVNDKKIEDLKKKLEEKKKIEEEKNQKEIEKAQKIKDSFDELMAYDYEQALKKRGDK